MIEIKENFGLLPYNTFRIDLKTKYFVEIKSENEFGELFRSRIFSDYEHLILGGGSNILFTRNFNGLIIHPMMDGIEVVDDSGSEILVRAGSGVVWDELVEYSVRNDWGGIENLSDIPGCVGASPVQNIGAYGREAADVIERVDGILLSSGEPISFNNAECHFGYRSSIFKKELKNNILICSVTFRLKKEPHNLITHYDSIEKQLIGLNSRTIHSVRKIVQEIRLSKLPKIEEIGNGGSFFKNPVVPISVAEKLQEEYEKIPVYKFNSKYLKLSAAWLIDQAGCKGIRKGNAGTYDKQPLVLINTGSATGQEILDLSNYIKETVYNKFGVQLEAEVNIF